MCRNLSKAFTNQELLLLTFARQRVANFMGERLENVDLKKFTKKLKYRSLKKSQKTLKMCSI